MVSIIIPTYKESENISHMCKAIDSVLNSNNIKYEIIFVDDDSRDGIVESCGKLAKSIPLRLVVRYEKRSLSASVIEGIRYANYNILVVMDADLSHPPSVIVDMVHMLESREADFVLGSRYVKGGSIDNDWSFFRRLTSKAGTFMALALTKICDPMSGFFALRAENMPDEKKLSGIGYKIGLEILVKGKFDKIREIPIHFSDRKIGESKLGLKEKLLFLSHIKSLYLFLYPGLTEFFMFAIVGIIGFTIDLTTYLELQRVFGIDHLIARAISFWVSASSNWAMNRAITFDHRKKTPKLSQWLFFISVAILGFLINWGSYYFLTKHIFFFRQNNIPALMLGTFLGMWCNFAASNFFVFGKNRDNRSKIADSPYPIEIEHSKSPESGNN